MTRYLITGATTPIGRALIRDLLQDDDTQRIIAVGGEATRDVEGDGRLTRLHVDLRRERSIRQLIFGPVRDEGVTTMLVVLYPPADVGVTGIGWRAAPPLPPPLNLFFKVCQQDRRKKTRLSTNSHHSCSNNYGFARCRYLRRFFLRASTTEKA